MKKFFPVLFVVIALAAFMVVPAFAQDGTPPTVPAPVFDMSQISEALQSLILALIVPLVGFAARWLSAQANYQKSLLSGERQYALDLFIKTCVYAAEQMQLKGFIDDKLAFVIGRAEVWLLQRGLVMDIDELRARIEAAVIEAFPKKNAAS